MLGRFASLLRDLVDDENDKSTDTPLRTDTPSRADNVMDPVSGGTMSGNSTPQRSGSFTEPGNKPPSEHQDETDHKPSLQENNERTGEKPEALVEQPIDTQQDLEGVEMEHDLEPAEQCIDVVPTETMPIPEPREFPRTGFVPSLEYTPNPNNGVPHQSSPSFMDKVDRSIEFIRREFDTLKYTLGTRPVLTHEEWFNLFNADGQMLELEQFYHYLMNYEWPPELLQDGWKYLFEYYDTHSNHAERTLLDKNKSTELQNILENWASILEDKTDEDEAARIEKLIYQINKDVPRTDRDHQFYKTNQDNSDVLRDLLTTFAFSNPDVGYVQGMNEVLSLFLITIEDKVAAYWAFSNYILKNKLFFNSTGLMAKLNAIAELLSQQDKELYAKLHSLDCSNMLFCQRWVLLGFKRECRTFDMAVKIFTILNSVQPTHYLPLQDLGRCELLSLDMFLVIAVLMSYRKEILSYTDQTDVYQWTGALKLADMSAICHAKQMYLQYEKEGF